MTEFALNRAGLHMENILKRPKNGRRCVANRQLLTAVIETLADIAAIDLEPQAIMQAITEAHLPPVPNARRTGRRWNWWTEEELVCQAVTGMTGPYMGVRFPIAGSMSGIAVRENEARSAATVRRTSVWIVRAAERSGRGSLVSVPLPHNGRVVGTLKVFSKSVDAFTASHVDAREADGGIAGDGLNHAMEFEAKKVLLAERTTAMTALRESEERFRMAFEYAAIGKTLVGLDGGLFR